jgi:nicotinate-nucleotide pyrophosphorylase (carboxylating)
MIDPLVVETVIEAALREDIGFCDLTSELVIPADAVADFTLESRQDIVVAGIDVAAAVFRRRVPDCTIELAVADGARLGAGGRLGRVRGPARGLLTAERTALNLLQHLSGIATLTARYVALIAHTKAVLVDTRKTTPGLRALEKHAAQVGGARNHRLRLDDGVMLKDNHIAVCGGIAAAVARARAGVPLLTKIEVECDTLDQVGEALASGADLLLLDNMDLASLRRAVALAAELGARRIPLEASGGINFDTIAGIAETGVDFISVGRITQSAPAVDIGLDVSWS